MKESTGEIMLIVLGCFLFLTFVYILIGPNGVFPNVLPQIDGIFNAKIPKL